jgi:hypothetical protein
VNRCAKPIATTNDRCPKSLLSWAKQLDYTASENGRVVGGYPKIYPKPENGNKKGQKSAHKSTPENGRKSFIWKI